MRSRVFFTIVALVFMYIIISNAKKKKFFETESFLWVLGCIPVLVLAIFPNIIKILSQLVGIEYAPSLLFLVAILFILYLLYRLTEQVSLLKDQNKELAQRIVILEKKSEDN